MKLKVARQLDQHNQSQSNGADYAHDPDVQFLFSKKETPVLEFAILPAFPDGEGPGSQNFLAYRTEDGEMTTWVEVYIIHEGFKNEIRNKTASPQNWNQNAIDPFMRVQSTVYQDKNLRDRLYRSGDLIQEENDDGSPRGKPKVPWSSRRLQYMNVRPTFGVDPGEIGKIRCLRVPNSAMTATGSGEGEVTSVWGLLDLLDMRNPEDPNSYIYADPTNPDAAVILRLQKADPPTRSPMKWWRVAPTRNPKITIENDELEQRYDLSKVVLRTSSEDSAKHFYEFCADNGGLIDVMEDLYPEFRPLGRDRLRAAQMSSRVPEEKDEIPGIIPVSRAPRAADSAELPVTSRTPARATTPAPAAEAAPVTTRQPAKAGVKRSTVTGALPVIPDELQEEVPPMLTRSMAAKEKTLMELLDGEPAAE